MEILHVAAECYPYAKAGGLGDVVGALPKYQNKLGHIAKVVMPMYRTTFLYNNNWETVHKGELLIGDWQTDYTIIKEKENTLGFDLYCVDIYGLLDREKIYGYDDDAKRFFAFQLAVVDWMFNWEHQPDIVHVHDYHAGLVPFLMQHTTAYKNLATIKTVLTIHNAQYQGWMNWDAITMFPEWDAFAWGNLDWNDKINPLASAIKCAWRVNTVSPSYMEEIKTNANGLEDLFNYEAGKCGGIINGIDTQVWNPATDTYLQQHYSIDQVQMGKLQNKKILCEQFNLDITKPLFVFIGRLVGEKAAEILPEVIRQCIYTYQGNLSFLVLGSGDPIIEQELTALNKQFVGYYNSSITYNEGLSHTMYAGADYLLMPSKVEPCGLNQLYAMRYGTIPMVRKTGGLKDTVPDIGDGGYGFSFNEATVSDVVHSIGRGIALFYNNNNTLQLMRKQVMAINFSWEYSAQQYIDMYQS
jgi:starch synthase